MKSLQKQTFAARIEQWKKGYFSPKDWEYDSGLRIYKIIGIRFFKKYLPTSGDIVRRWRNQTAIDVRHRDLNHQQYQAELHTRKYELRHIFGTLGFLIIACLVEKKTDCFRLLFSDHPERICKHISDLLTAI